MAFLGWRKWPTPASFSADYNILKPLWPFMVAASISLYGISKLQDMSVRSPEWAKDPRNPYAGQIAAE
ncbi:ATPase, F0 complex, subunit J, partial [Mycena vitilis]